MADTDRNNKGQFTTGNTCGGRKRIPKDFLDAVLSYTSEALQTIIEIMQNQKAPMSLRFKAATYIIDRSFGKPLDTLMCDVMHDLPFTF